MAWSLGSLFIELKANTAQFLDGMSKASAYTQKTGREIERSFSRLGGAASTALAPLGELATTIGRTFDTMGQGAGRAFGQIGKMGGSLGIAAGVAGGAVAALAAVDLAAIGIATHAAHAAAKFHDLSQSTGVAVEALSGLSYVAKQNGVDTETLAKALEKLNKSAFTAAIAPEGAKNAWTRLGISVRDANGNIRSTEALFSDLAKKFQAMPDGPIKTALAIEMLGRAGATIIPVLNSDVASLLKEARALGVVLDSETAAAADTFTDQLEAMKTAGTGASYTLMKELLPALQTVTRAMVEGLKEPSSAFRALIGLVGSTSKAFIMLGNDVWTGIKQTGIAIVAYWGLLGETAGSASRTISALIKGDFEGATKGLAGDYDRMDAMLGSFLDDSKKLWQEHAQFTQDLWAKTPRVAPGAHRPPGGGAEVDTARIDPLADKIKKRIALLEQETAEYLKVAQAAGDSTAAARLADANREAEKVITGLRDEASQLKANQKVRTDLVALVDRQAERIRALYAVQAAAKDAAGLGVEMEKQSRAYRDQIAAITDLTHAYATGGMAVALAEVDKQLDAERRKLQDLADVYGLLTQKPGVTAAELTILARALDAANAKFQEHYHQLVQVQQAQIGLEVAQNGSKIAAQLAGIEALTKAYFESSEAIRAAESQAELLNWQQAHPGATPEQIGAMARQIKSLASAHYGLKIAQQAAGLSIVEIYTAETQRLREIRDALTAQGRSAILVDAQIYDLNQNLLRQWDEAALRVGTLHEKWTAFGNEIILMGRDLGAKVFGSLLRAIDDVSTELARLVVTGKANFKELFQSLAMEIAKANIQNLFGKIAAAIGKKFGLDLGSILGLGGKRDGSSAAKALYVTSVDAAGKLLGGALGGTSPPAGSEIGKAAEGIEASLSQSLAKIGDAVGSAFKSIGSFLSRFGKLIWDAVKGIASFFGGFMAGGGDVSPGRAYIVGEKHPELFIPKRAGEVVPTIPLGNQRPVVYQMTWNITTPDADSFRRSQDQIVADGYHIMRTVAARH